MVDCKESSTPVNSAVLKDPSVSAIEDVTISFTTPLALLYEVRWRSSGLWNQKLVILGLLDFAELRSELFIFLVPEYCDALYQI